MVYTVTYFTLGEALESDTMICLVHDPSFLNFKSDRISGAPTLNFELQ